MPPAPRKKKSPNRKAKTSTASRARKKTTRLKSWRPAKVWISSPQVPATPPPFHGAPALPAAPLSSPSKKEEKLGAAPKVVWGPWATAAWGLFIFIAWSIAQAIPMIVVAFGLDKNSGRDAVSILESAQTNGFGLTLAVIFGAVAGLVLIGIVVKLKKGARFGDYLALNPLSWKTQLAVVGASIGYCLACDWLSAVLDKGYVSQFMNNFYASCGSPPLFCLGVVFLGPLMEEFFFRGFLLEGLRHSRLGNWGAGLLTSAAWASLHMQYDFFTIVTIFMGGLILAYVRLKTGSLWACVTFHVAWSIYAVTVLILFLK